ncbi:hypothetical protein Bca4012_071184 [Brassica carinata]
MTNLGSFCEVLKTPSLISVSNIRKPHPSLLSLYLYISSAIDKESGRGLQKPSPLSLCTFFQFLRLQTLARHRKSHPSRAAPSLQKQASLSSSSFGCSLCFLFPRLRVCD